MSDSDVWTGRVREVERAFRSLLEGSGVALEALEVTSAARFALEFLRDVRFDWISTEADSDAYSASTLLERAPPPAVHPLVALFKKPEPGPPEAAVLTFDRVMTTFDGAFIHWSLDLEFDPDGLETLEEMELSSDDVDSVEEFARQVLKHSALRRLSAIRPRSVTLWVG